MTTAEDYESIAYRVYNVDPSWQGPPTKVGDTFYTDRDKSKQQWRVIDVAANAKNGFQGMAVVRVVGGVPDYSEICIAYAGTNFNDSRDVLTDANLVMRGKAGPGSQASDALKFAEKVQREAAKDHPGAKLTTTGHSLGGFLALLVAAFAHLSSTTFNAPDPWAVLPPEVQDWLTEQNAAGTNPLKNYVNKFDTVGNSLGDKTGAADYVEDVPGRPLEEYHNIGKDKNGKPHSFRYDATGGIIGAGADWVDFGVILCNVDQRWAAEQVWSGTDSPYPKVLVAMEPAFALAEKIQSLAEPLREIRKANSALTSEMQEVLDEAKREYPFTYQFVTHADVETCVALHELEVRQNIDEDAVAAVNTLVDKQLKTVKALHEGIHNAIINTLAHDVYSAAAFTTH